MTGFGNDHSPQHSTQSPFMPLCLILQPIHAAGHAALEAAGIDITMDVARLPDADAMIIREAPWPALPIAQLPRLRVIAKHGVGVNNIPVADATACGVPVVYTPGANQRSTAELAIALMLACARQLPAADLALRRGDWSFRFRSGVELAGKTLGVVGFGGIGAAVARIASLGLAMKVIVFSPNAPDDTIAATGATRVATIDVLLRGSDVVSLHQPLRADNQKLISTRELALMKPSAILINTARGGLIDEAALHHALATKQIAGAGIDVFVEEPPAPNHPLFALENIVVAPHIGAATEDSMRAMAQSCAAQIIDVLAGRRPAHPVNPTVLR